MILQEAVCELEALASHASNTTGRVVLSRARDWATLVVENPTAKNAMTMKMMWQLSQCVLSLTEDPVGLLLVKGHGDTFCSGGHLVEVQRHLMSGEGGVRMGRAMTAVLDALSELPTVSVAAICGSAVGGGAELAMACDLRLISAEGRIHFVHSRLGLVPGWGATRHLVTRIGAGKALEVLLEGRSYSGEDAHRIGLASEVLPDPWSESLASWLAERARLGMPVLTAMKRQVLAAQNEARKGLETQAFSTLWGGERHAAAVEAVLRRLAKS